MGARAGARLTRPVRPQAVGTVARWDGTQNGERQRDDGVHLPELDEFRSIWQGDGPCLFSERMGARAVLVSCAVVWHRQSFGGRCVGARVGYAMPLYFGEALWLRSRGCRKALTCEVYVVLRKQRKR